MKRVLISILIAFVAIDIWGACIKKPDPTTVLITIVDGRTGSAVSGTAMVSLYPNQTAVNNNAADYIQIADQNNQVTITVDYLSKYYVVVTKGTAKNYYSGLIPIGIFQSQTDINNSPIQSPAGTVGGVKYQDTNGDGKITALDQTDAPTIAVTQSVSNTQTITVY